MRKFIFFVALTTSFTNAALAQDYNYQNDGQTPTIAPSTEVLMMDYNNRTYLKENVQPTQQIVRNSDASDAVIEQRLKRIQTTIDLPLNDITRSYIDKYANNMKRSVSVMLASMNFYRPIFEDALEKYQLPLELQYLPVIESALRPSATSPAGAAGLWQFIPSTGKRYGLVINTLVDERRDPIKSTDAACRYLRDLYARFGDWSLAIAGYNCGEGSVQKALARSGGKEGKTFWDIYNFLPRETRGYVPAFIAATYIMNYYCEHGITPMMATLPEQSDTIQVEHDVRLSKIAAECGVSLDQIKALNPQFRQDIVPASYAIRLPSESIERFVEKEEELYSAYVGRSSYAMNNNAKPQTNYSHSTNYNRTYKKRRR